MQYCTLRRNLMSNEMARIILHFPLLRKEVGDSWHKMPECLNQATQHPQTVKVEVNGWLSQAFPDERHPSIRHVFGQRIIKSLLHMLLYFNQQLCLHAESKELRNLCRRFWIDELGHTGFQAFFQPDYIGSKRVTGIQIVIHIFLKFLFRISRVFLNDFEQFWSAKINVLCHSMKYLLTSVCYTANSKNMRTFS